MTTDASVRVVVADDEALVRAGFRAILETAGGIDVVGEAANGVDAVQVVRDTSPDVILLDIQMPQLDGLDAARRILSFDDPPRVIMLTTFDLDEHVYAAMRMGASGFLVKDTPREQLVAAVRTVSARDALLSPSTARRLVDRFLSVNTPAAQHTLPVDRLSTREIDVWRTLARGLSNAEIGRELFISEATVKTHVARILAKLELRDRAQAIIAAYEAGIVRPR